MRPQHMQPQRRNRALIVVLSILAVILAAAGVLSWMVLNDPNAGKGLENTQPSDALALTAIRSRRREKRLRFPRPRSTHIWPICWRGRIPQAQI